MSISDKVTPGVQAWCASSGGNYGCLSSQQGLGISGRLGVLPIRFTQLSWKGLAWPSSGVSTGPGFEPRLAGVMCH